MQKEALTVYLGDHPIARWSPVSQGDEIVYEGNVFYYRAELSGLPLFYDWLEDTNGNVCGIELHDRDDESFSNETRSLHYISCSPYPQIRLSRSAIVVQRGAEMFGNMRRFRSNNGHWLIIICPMVGLSEKDILSLDQIVES